MKWTLVLACMLIGTASGAPLKRAYSSVLSKQSKLRGAERQGKTRPRNILSGAGSAVSALPLTVQECTSAGGCESSTKYIVADQNWRWYYHPTDYTSCFENNQFTCNSASACANCELQDMADSTGGYDYIGVSTDGGSLQLKYSAPSGGTGSRVYLMDGNGADDEYTMLRLVGKEIAFDVALSTLGCGFNGAAYLVEMASDGSKSSGAQGAIYGTGYCDAQCPSDLHTTVGGQANYAGSSICCNEMDIWEANDMAYATTPHPCADASGNDLVGPTSCTGEECSNGLCDSSGCDFNPYRNGAPSFYGDSLTVDSSQTMTVVTQFIGDENTGVLAEIRKLFVVNGVVINQTETTVNGNVHDSITTSYCTDENEAFGNNGDSTFSELGGLARMGDAMQRGMVMVFSVWNDPSSHMLWLDGTTGSGAGDVRGPCGTTDSSETSSIAEKASVTFSNVKWGDIGSTYIDSGKTPSPTAPSPQTPTPAPTAACLTDAGAHCAYGGLAAPICCGNGMVCCDNGASSGDWASCQTESYCNSASCETDGGRSVPCAIVNV